MALAGTFKTATAVVVVALALTACGSDSLTREEAVQRARAAPVRQASAAAAARLDTLLSTVSRHGSRLTPVAKSTADICHAGMTNGFSAPDPFWLTCRRDETSYFAADGEVLDVLRDLDAGALAAGLSPYGNATFQDVTRYYAADGRSEDGRRLSEPRLAYDGPGQEWTPLSVRWSQASDPRRTDPDPGLGWPVILNERRDVDVDALWSGPLRGRRHLIGISSSVTYHEIPWPR